MNQSNSILTLLSLLGIADGIVFSHQVAHEGTCSSRFEHRYELKEQFVNCAHLYKKKNICLKDFTIAYSLHPPYVFHDKNGKVKGVLPDMLQFAFDTCCYGCNKVKYIGPYKNLERFEQNASLVIPIQTSQTTKSYFGHPYVYMLDVNVASFLGPEIKHDSNKMALTILTAALNSWPLFLTMFVMVLTAGATIWILDTRKNSNEFPLTFPTGIMEGSWWAFISMTTVGYGDRSPRSWMARIFAGIWIIIGIIIFTSFTASLTSSLTSAIIATHEISIYQKTFAVLNTTSIGNRAAMKENANIKGYQTIEEISKAIHEKQVDGVALDENIANFYMGLIQKEGSHTIRLYKRRMMSDCSYGMVVYDRPTEVFFKSFFEGNDDQRDIMARLALSSHPHPVKPKVEIPDTNEFFTYESPFFLPTIIVLLSITLVLIVTALLFKWIRDLMQNRKGESISMKYMTNNDELLTLVEEIYDKLKIKIQESKLELNGNRPTEL